MLGGIQVRGCDAAVSQLVVSTLRRFASLGMSSSERRKHFENGT